MGSEGEGKLVQAERLTLMFPGKGQLLPETPPSPLLTLWLL